MKKIHFLHIPKTAGQSVHQMLVDGFKHISPLRVNSQFQDLGDDSVTDTYDVISGHIDWSTMELGGDAEFTFTVLRKPVDRILSFYHYLRSEAKKLNAEELSQPERKGMYNALNLTPDEYFLSKDKEFSTFINNHYNNFYMYFFASKSYDGFHKLSSKSNEEVFYLAMKNMGAIDKIYTLDSLTDLPIDLRERFPDCSNEINGLTHVNKGDKLSAEERLKLLSKIGPSEKAIKEINKMCLFDNVIFNLVAACN